MSALKTIRLLKQDILVDIEKVEAKDGVPAHEVRHTVTNNPGAILALPVAEADQRIADGIAVEHIEEPAAADPAEESSTSAGEEVERTQAEFKDPPADFS